MKKLTITHCTLLLLLLLLSCCTADSINRRENFDSDWKFLLGDNTEAWRYDFDDSSWRVLDLPHDWSVEGSFSESNPAMVGGGALPGGIGWYRKTFVTEDDDKGREVYVEFDGVYRNSEVWINGNYLGKRPYGYSSFRYCLTPYLKNDGEKNTIAVKVDNSKQPNSRWYSGSGIYRHVWLDRTGPVAVDHWGTYVTTPVVNSDEAELYVQTRIRNTSGTAVTVTVVNTLYDAEDRKVGSAVSRDMVLTDTLTIVEQTLKVKKPHLWSDEDPYLYNVVTGITEGNRQLDLYETTTGIRSFVFDVEKGFILNGRQVKIRGVCNHHDLGCLGAAVNTRAMERQLELLKEMGCNAIRTSHNPPAPELLDLCDRMGFIVMDEAFDMWRKTKMTFDYSHDFDQWHKRDLEDMILRDRNHPSVFIWSIGNEIIEQWDSSGTPLATELAGIVRSLDTTRPITSACNEPTPWNFIIRSGALDLIGYNYRDTTFASFPRTFPGQKFIASETTSALATRGSYDMPSDSIRRWPQRWDAPLKDANADLTCSSYDNCSTPWGSTHEESWRRIKAHDYLSGLFIWTGFDYLGEPTPYPWPARSSYFGIIDLAGFPKDAYYMYQSEWTDKPVLHIFPHWNWNEGDTVDVWAYSSCDEVELFLNGESLGAKKKGADDLHLMWRVAYKPGTVSASGLRDGKELMRSEIRTAGAPDHIALKPDRTTISAGGEDLSFVRVEILDRDGNIVPYADNMVSFTVDGGAAIAGVDNGLQTSMESFKSNSRMAFHGLCLVVIRSPEKAGRVTLKAESPGLVTAETVITIK